MEAHDRSPEPGNAAWLVPLAAAGDAIIFLLFAAIGRASHHETVFTAIPRTVGTALPFLAGWFGAAALWRSYAPTRFATYRSAFRRLLATLTTGILIALAIRSLLEHRIVPATFAAIALVFNGLLLAAWRAILVTVTRPR